MRRNPLNMKERRRLERFDLKIPATIESVTSDQEKRVLNLLTSNISSGTQVGHTSIPHDLSLKAPRSK